MAVDDAAPPSKKDGEAAAQVGWRVCVAGDGNLQGTVRFVGEAEFAAGAWAGVELEMPAGSTDGSVGGVRYFTCEMNHGIFVRPELLVPEGSTWRSPEQLGEDGPPFGVGEAAPGGGGGTCGSPQDSARRREDAQRRLAEALEDRQHCAVLHELLPEALSLGVDSSEVASAARVAAAGLAQGAALDDPAGSTAQVCGGAVASAGYSPALMRRYKAVQDCLAQLIDATASLRTVVITGPTSPAVLGADFQGEAARQVTYQDLGLVGTWQNPDQSQSGSYTISVQVGEDSQQQLCYQETMWDRRRLSCWLSRREGQYLFGDLCNAYSKDVLGTLRVRADSSRQAVTSFRRAGSSDWGPEVIASRVEQSPQASQGSRGGGGPHDGGDHHTDVAGELDAALVPAEGKKSSAGLMRMFSPSKAKAPEQARSSDSPSPDKAAGQGRKSLMGVAMGTAKRHTPGVVSKKSSLESPRPSEDFDKFESQLSSIAEAVKEIREAVREKPSAVDFGPVLQAIDNSTVSIVEKHQEGLRKSMPTSIDFSVLVEAIRQREIDFSPLERGIQQVFDEVRGTKEDLRDSIATIARDIAAAQSTSVKEVARDIREAIATVPPAAAEALAPVTQALRDRLQDILTIRQDTKEVNEAIKEGRISVEFAPVFLEMHKYMALIQETVRNGANLSPILDAIRRGSKSMMKKLEDAEAAQSAVITQELGSATREILSGVRENGANGLAMEDKFFFLQRAIGKLTPVLEAIRDNKMEIDMTEVLQAIRASRSQVDATAVLRAINDLRGQSIIALPSARGKTAPQAESIGTTATLKTTANNEDSSWHGVEEMPSAARTFSAVDSTGSLSKEEVATAVLFGRVMYGETKDGPDCNGELHSSTLNPFSEDIQKLSEV